MQLYERHVSPNGKVSYTPYDITGKHNPSKPMTDHEKTMFLTLGLSAMETIKDNEIPKSARRMKMDNLIEHQALVIDVYRPKSWNDAMISKASMIVDAFDAKIQEEFGR